MPTASSKLPSLRPTSTSDDDDLVEIVGYVLGTAAGVVIIILVTICLFIIVIKRQNKRNQQQQELNELSYWFFCVYFQYFCRINECTLRYVRNFVKMTSSDKLLTSKNWNVCKVLIIRNLGVETSLKLLEDFNSAGLIIDNTSLRLLDSIGQGEELKTIVLYTHELINQHRRVWFSV